MKFVWGILPVFFRQSRDRWGHANGPVISLPHDYTKVMVAHELHHVKQFYAVSLPLLALTVAAFVADPFCGFWTALAALSAYVFWKRSDFGKFIRETAAYGVSLRNMDSDAEIERNLIWYSNVLSGKDYDLGRSYEACHDRIAAKFENGGLF